MAELKVNHLTGHDRVADLWIPFLVDSGRYPSIFDVMRDGYGINRSRKATTTFCVGLQRKRSDDSRPRSTPRDTSAAMALVGSTPRSGLSFDRERTLPSDQSLPSLDFGDVLTGPMTRKAIGTTR